MDSVQTLKGWLVAHGGGFHPDVDFAPVPSGFVVVARDVLGPDTTVVSCPFTLAITPDVARAALIDIGLAADALAPWPERQLIATYIVFHGFYTHPALRHLPYIATLPAADKLRTPLHFTPGELASFKGTNIYGATLDRERDWRVEWEQAAAAAASASPAWGDEVTWSRYLTAATYVSSRAFPSSLLADPPSLAPGAHPVLLPGVDALNHARARPVTWAVRDARVALVVHAPAAAGDELHNNYGAKPNAELVLGYGFALHGNPDDTVALRAAALPGRWEVGRGARGADTLWRAMVRFFEEGAEEDAPAYEAGLEAAGALAHMTQDLLARLPRPDAPTAHLRPDVAEMLGRYVEGQRDVLQSLIGFAHIKEQEAVAAARALGIELVLADEDGDE